MQDRIPADETLNEKTAKLFLHCYSTINMLKTTRFTYNALLYVRYWWDILRVLRYRTTLANMQVVLRQAGLRT